MLGGDDALLALAYVTLLALPGVPVLLYGDEIGLGDDLSQPERNAVRLAMQWTAEDGGGFSEASTEQLQVPLRADGPYGYRRRNVRDAEADPGSLLHRLRAAVAARRAAPELSRGRCEAIDAGPVFALRYEHDGSVVVLAMNLSDRDAPLPELPSGGHARGAAGGPDPEATSGPLPPAGYRWLRLPRRAFPRGADGDAGTWHRSASRSPARNERVPSSSTRPRGRSRPASTRAGSPTTSTRGTTSRVRARSCGPSSAASPP